MLRFPRHRFVYPCKWKQGGGLLHLSHRYIYMIQVDPSMSSSMTTSEVRYVITLENCIIKT